jgi:hypothetical protein
MIHCIIRSYLKFGYKQAITVLIAFEYVSVVNMLHKRNSGGSRGLVVGFHMDAAVSISDLDVEA